MRSRRLKLTAEPPSVSTTTTNSVPKQLQNPALPPQPARNHNILANSSSNVYNEASAALTSSMVVTVLVLLTAFFFMSFLSFYFRHFINDASASTTDDSRPRRHRDAGIRQSSAPSGGLDQEVIVALPTFPYKTVYDDYESSLCAVCLGQFESGETVKLLPLCGHFFHVECIDSWLFLHNSCPLCRTNLLPPPPTDKYEAPAAG